MQKREKAQSVALPLPTTPWGKAPSKAVTKLDAKPTTTAKPTAVKAKVDVSKKASRYELWQYDEYNQGTIIFSSADLDKVVERARGYVTEANVDNALTSGEKYKQWEVYFVEIFKGKTNTKDTLYAGNKKDGRHYVYAHVDGEWKMQLLSKDAKIKFFLGNLNGGRVKEPWYLADYKGTEIDNLSDQALERKAVVFIKVV